MFETDEKQSENIPKTEQKPVLSDVSELRESLLRAEQGEDNAKTTNNTVNDKNNVAWVCPERLIDFLEDKPYMFADYVFLSSRGATAKERKEILDRLPITDGDKKLSRPWIKKLIESFVEKNPELGNFFSEDNILMIRILSREWEVHGMLNLIRERDSAKNVEINDGH